MWHVHVACGMWHVHASPTQAVKGKLRKDLWESSLTQLLVDGATRRGHLLCLIAVETLRDVGFTAAELLGSGHTLAELRAGGFTVRETARRARRTRHLGCLCMQHARNAAQHGTRLCGTGERDEGTWSQAERAQGYRILGT